MLSGEIKVRYAGLAMSVASLFVFSAHGQSGIALALAKRKAAHEQAKIAALRSGKSPVLVETKALTLPAPKIHLAWDYTANGTENDLTNIVFNVWKAGSDFKFQPYTNVATLEGIWPADGAVGLFEVRSSNILTGAVSIWATK